jgi:hypothetical protein
MSKREHWPFAGGLPTTDLLMAADQEPPLGAHLLTPRREFLHHGIYVGGRKVVHYSGLAYGARGGPVEELPLARFASGKCVWIRTGTLSRFAASEVVSRARSRIGEDNYRLLTNNCEHFCEWCLSGMPRSLQVEAWLLFRRLRPPRSGGGKQLSDALISALDFDSADAETVRR